MTDNERDAMDKLLDEALSTYANRSPGPDLEERVLRRVRAAAVAPRRSFPRWIFAVPVAACILWVVLVRMTRVPEPARPEVAKVAPSPAVPRIAPRIISPQRTRNGRPQKPSTLPKQPEFPASAPVTAEERALLAFVERAPEQARELLIDARERSDQPIRMEDIQIPPLQSDQLK